MDEHMKKVVLRWWQSMFLPPSELLTKHLQAAPTAHKAQLKRCESADAAMMTEGFRSLWLQLPDEVINNDASQHIECWATIAAILVHVKKDVDSNIATQAGKKGNGDNSLVSELRFAQLQNAKTPEDFARRMRRIVQQIKGEVSVLSLANDIQQWFVEHYQFRRRSVKNRISIRWAMDYYRAASSKIK